MWRALQEATLIVLCISAIISLILKLAIPNSDEGETRSTGWIEGASILGTVAIVVVVTAANDFVKDKQFRKLEQEKDNESVLVFRDSMVQQVRVFDLVVRQLLLYPPTLIY
jgi:magnesium-transporting ATPase (P-type)